MLSVVLNYKCDRCGKEFTENATPDEVVSNWFINNKVNKITNHRKVIEDKYVYLCEDCMKQYQDFRNTISEQWENWTDNFLPKPTK